MPESSGIGGDLFEVSPVAPGVFRRIVLGQPPGKGVRRLFGDKTRTCLQSGAGSHDGCDVR